MVSESSASAQVVVTRADAKSLNLKFFFTGEPCKYGHVAQRYVSSFSCIDCKNYVTRRYTEEQKIKNRLASKARYNRNKERVLQKHKEWNKNNRERKLANDRAWHRRNPEYKRWKVADRRAKKIMRTPIWSELEKIKLFYANRPEGYHVDHIVPLCGKNVCGLHVLANLQYLPARENLVKGNNF